MTMIMSSSNSVGQFGDTTLTKVFVGGLAWETPKEALKQHFEKYGEILEAVIISDKHTGRSKGYGFVTFKEAEAAKKACEDQAALIINGRRANCNLASLGARRPRPSATASSPPPQPKEGSNGGGPRNNASSTASANHVQWYYPVGTPTSPFHPHHLHHALPFYGYTPTYVAMDINYNYNYNQKLSYGGGYISGGHHLSHVYPRQAIVGANTLMPMYPLYQYHHPTETMGVPAHFFHPTVAGHYAAVPAGIVSKPAPITPHTGASHGNMSNPVNSILSSALVQLVLLIALRLLSEKISWLKQSTGGRGYMVATAQKNITLI